jgi:hypothetical protein
MLPSPGLGGLPLRIAICASSSRGTHFVGVVGKVHIHQVVTVRAIRAIVTTTAIVATTSIIGGMNGPTLGQV